MKTNYLPLLVLLFVLSPIVQAQENHLAGYEQKSVELILRITPLFRIGKSVF